MVFSCWHKVQNCGQPAVYQYHSYKTVLNSISKDVDSSIKHRKYRMRLWIMQKLSFWTGVCALHVLGEFISSAGLHGTHGEGMYSVDDIYVGFKRH